MKRVLPTLKSVCILALVALAIFQIGRLWLVDLTNRSFFPYLEARFPTATPHGQNAWARPFRIVYGAGDGRFNMIYEGIATSDEWGFGERALESLLAGGSFVGRVDLLEILGEPVLIFEYAIDMRAESFARSLGRRNAGILGEAGVETFRRVAVHPPESEGGALRAVFISDDYAWEFVLPTGTRRHPTGDFNFPIAPVDPIPIYFAVVNESGGFAPRASRRLSYTTVLAENPYRDHHDILTLHFIRTQVESFFDNPATIIHSVSADNVWTFSTLNIMVRYLPSDVLEYTSFRTMGQVGQGDLLADFAAALAFIDRDPLVTNEVFLSGYEDRGREYVFLFNYVIDNRPLVLTEAWATGQGCVDPLRAPIEVVVDHGRVIRYRRLAYNFRLNDAGLMPPDALDVERAFALGFPIGRGELRLSVFWEEF